MEFDTVRKQSRLPGTFPVRIYGMDVDGKPFNTTVFTLNIATGEILLGGVEPHLNVGDLIGARYQTEKGKCRVRWVGSADSGTQGQLRVECLDGFAIGTAEDRQSSGTVVPADPDCHVGVGAAPAFERRSATRYNCDIGVQIGDPDSEVKLWSRCTDISEGGCYIDTRAPLPVGAKVELTLFLEPESLRLEAIVKTSFPGMGMGVQLQFRDGEQLESLRRALQRKFRSSNLRILDAPKKNPDLKKLFACVGQMLAWGDAAYLQDCDRQSFEALAAELRQELHAVSDEPHSRTPHRSSTL